MTAFIWTIQSVCNHLTPLKPHRFSCGNPLTYITGLLKLAMHVYNIFKFSSHLIESM